MESATKLLFVSAILRLAFFSFGLYQDKYMEVKYTDVDYMVFTDASRFLYSGRSPYLRETYRYTPLLSVLLLPNNFLSPNFGKFLFMATDLIVGYLIIKILAKYGNLTALKRNILASIWLLNPVVITISSRGNSESLLIALIMMAIYFLLVVRNYYLSGFFLGLSIHFKIYPFIYLTSILFYLTGQRHQIYNLINEKSIKFSVSCIVTFFTLTSIMYYYFGYEFLYESYIYHLVRVDHRHNFSIYNLSLYFNSSIQNKDFFNKVESVAFIPQLLISFFIIPLKLSKIDLISTFFVQTFVFVTFNKVITSQYFVWFLCFLPFYLRDFQKNTKSFLYLALWILTQGIWLSFAYKLEFLGISTFYPGLFFSSCSFFIANVLLIGDCIDHIRSKDLHITPDSEKKNN
ncbi:hypothetical protein PACTADRAFT_41132 [Pachysolen tannophilus NRRL Y-2460]|uniref:GPI mannosyltransferase 1 n=1 Tax=Pachysolen tannophilus NRRL Y-2460 TaxID=669874 RepID=A0A1E4TVL0_PACTA|nr:hypothetical protein PACTADRAFT_41132 [Pachysolen tannophilus NRRL Y-2460]